MYTPLRRIHLWAEIYVARMSRIREYILARIAERANLPVEMRVGALFALLHNGSNDRAFTNDLAIADSDAVRGQVPVQGVYNLAVWKIVLNCHN